MAIKTKFIIKMKKKPNRFKVILMIVVLIFYTIEYFFYFGATGFPRNNTEIIYSGIGLVLIALLINAVDFNDWI